MDKVVENILEDLAAKEGSLKSTEVLKDLAVDIDEGNLLLVDNNLLDQEKLKQEKETYLTELARGNTQLLINALFKLPTQTDDVVVATLPDPRTVLPREKAVPKPKAPTKWEQYARLKGIQNKKKGRKVWDEQKQDWKPRWGYDRVGAEKRDWMLEVPGNADPMEDQFEKRLKAKQERVAKNELQRLRNLARNSKGRVPGVGLTPIEQVRADKEYTKRALDKATLATASLGKFTKPVKDEEVHTRGVRARKRKRLPAAGDSGAEKRRALDILQRVQRGQPIVDVDKAANRQLQAEQRERAGERREKRGGKRSKQGSKQGKHFSDRGSKKGAAGKKKGGKGMGGKKGGRGKGPAKKGTNKLNAAKGRKGGNKR